MWPYILGTSCGGFLSGFWHIFNNRMKQRFAVWWTLHDALKSGFAKGLFKAKKRK